MKYLALMIGSLIACITTCAHAGALEDCYSKANEMEQVGECLDRHLAAAKQRNEDVYEYMMKIALAMDNAQRQGEYVPALSSAQRQWAEYAESNCDLHRISSGSSTGGKHFKTSCLIEAYNKRTSELQVYFAEIVPEPH